MPLERVRALAEAATRSRGVGMIVASRTLPPKPFETVHLEGLSAAEAQALLEREVGAPLPDAATDWMYGSTLGNPLFMFEYLRYLARQGYLWNDARRWHWRKPPEGMIPTTVEALLERLIGQLPLGPSKDALEAAAMLPAGASKALWAEVAGLSEGALENAASELEQRGLFRSGTFVHPLFREVTLAGLAPLRRRELSRRALAALEDDPQTAAGFVVDAGLEPGEAVGLLKRAAGTAGERGDGARRPAPRASCRARLGNGQGRAGPRGRPQRPRGGRR